MTSLVSDLPVYIWFTASHLWFQRNRENRESERKGTNVSCILRRRSQIIALCCTYRCLYVISTSWQSIVPHHGAAQSDCSKCQNNRKVSHIGIWRRSTLQTKSIISADGACSWGRWITNCHNKGITGDNMKERHRSESCNSTSPHLRKSPLPHKDFYHHHRQENLSVNG